MNDGLSHLAIDKNSGGGFSPVMAVVWAVAVLGWLCRHTSPKGGGCWSE
jgi:hypothetical protein